jgi:uncharacterized protein YbaR (Trm112 family)
MHIEFVDMLRCPRPHEETWLVAAINEMRGRLIVEGKLGCPVCSAEFPIHDGVAIFGERFQPPNASTPVTNVSNLDEAATRIAAFLDLSRPGVSVLLAGDAARAAAAVASLTGARVIALNSPTHASDENVAELEAGMPIPLASSSLDGIALDAAHSVAPMLKEAARLLRPRGRLLASSIVDFPPSFNQLARDESQMVAEYIGELISIRR